jgi:amidase
MRALALLLLLATIGGCLAPASQLAGNAAKGPAGAVDCLGTVAGLDLQRATIPGIQAMLSSGKITSVQLVEAYVARIRAFDNKTNSVQVVMPDALAQAAALDAERAEGHVRGPLHGIPILLKDNVAAAGAPTTAGSIALANNTPPQEATLTQKLRDAGAIILGKTKMSEFAQWISLNNPNGYSSLGGQVVDPYTMGDPSGSSSGSGVAGTMAFATATIGTETQGSILGPSDANSLVGVKPTTGLVSRAGVIPLAASYDTPGPMGRDVTDVAIVLAAIAGPDARDPMTQGAKTADYVNGLKIDALRGVRLGYVQDYASDPIFAKALDDLKKAGATLVPIQWSSQEDQVGTNELALITNEFKFGINSYLATQAGPGLPVKDLTDIILYNQQHPDKVKYGQDLLVASDATPGDGNLATVTGLASRTATQTALAQVFAKDQLAAIVGPSLAYYQMGAEAGYPTVIVPAGYNGKAPEGLSIFGEPWSEAKLLSYAYAYEQTSMRREPPTTINPPLLQGVCS